MTEESKQPLVWFVDLPADFFPLHIKWTDIATGEIVREVDISEPGAVSGGFGAGRLLNMEIKLGNGEKLEVVCDGRV